MAEDEGTVSEQQENIPQEPTEEELAQRVELEEEARKYGWRDKTEFDLAPDGWVDADRFLELPATQVKIGRDTIKELRDRDAQRDKEFAALKATAEQAVQTVKERERQSYEAKLADIQAQKREAAEGADIETYTRLEEQERELKAPEPPQTQKDVYQPTADHIEKYPWLQDPVLVAYGSKALQDLGIGDNVGVEQQLRAADMHLRSQFPNHFQEPEKPQVRQKVDSGGLGFGAKRGQGASDLPPEAMQAAKDFVAEGIFKSVDDYAKSYFSHMGATS